MLNLNIPGPKHPENMESYKKITSKIPGIDEGKEA